MARTKTVLKVKGLHTPRLLLWMKGFLDRTLHTGGIDPENGEISSSYITGQVARFEEACEKRIAAADDKIKGLWAEADNKLIDYANLPQIERVPDYKDVPGITNGAAARIHEKAEKDKAFREAKRIDIVKRLSDIENLILAESIQVDEEIAATANQLSSCLAAYGHGLLFKPVYPHMIPSIDTSKYAGKICKIRERDTTWNAMTCVVKKEELKNDVV